MTLEQQSAEAKSARLLDLYARFISGQTLNKQDLASEYGVTTRSIQRDMESLRCFLMEKGLSQEIIYDRRHGGYRMVSSVPSGLTNSEILAVCKILLESRSMRRDEMLPILDKLVDCAVPPEQRQAVKLLIGNEKLHYIEPHHGKSILNGLWEIGQAVKEQRVMEIEYERMKAPKLVTRRVQPVGIMFSEYYFYLTAFLENKDNFENPDDLFPTIYRLDRIRSFKVLDEHSLYHDLRSKIEDLDRRMERQGHIVMQEELAQFGGVHDLLFLLKSFDLDLRMNYPLGTVFGYGMAD